AEYVDAPVDAVVFNLGWLPGGEKTVTTLCDTTLQAVAAGAELLKPGGLMTICIYPGHPEGARERDALLEWARGLNPQAYDVLLKAYLNQPNQPPMMLAVRRRI
ncbi:MAG: class I SAM-dependent methyltransferase, partial [Eubacteriales bacterium]|nr:class I SAM-dependent methyltransferase [Eubacteriales bacterium]